MKSSTPSYILLLAGNFMIKSWRQLLDEEGIVQLPVAHDALTAKLIAKAGFPAYQIGGFATIAAHFGVPDLDIVHYGELSFIIEKIINVNNLPVLVDCDNGYGDNKMVIRVAEGYERLGASAIFIEDQASPKRCGHMAGKKIVRQHEMIGKIKAALDGFSNPETFLLARTDAYEVEGLSGAENRAEAYLNAGAHGVYVEGISKESDVENVGYRFRDVPLAISILENGGQTPWMTPNVLRQMGYNMILYPSTLIFRIMKATKHGLTNLRNVRELGLSGVYMEAFEETLDINYWQEVEQRR
jgi:2-methylisocitrate lyase-like PEP mutase family enzyme